MRLIPFDVSKMDLKPVTSYQIKKSKYDKNGLFSEQIFGPIRSYKCWCKESSTEVGQVCPTCGIKITSSSERRKTFAKIPVDRIINPIIVNIINSFPAVKKIVDKILTGKLGTIYNEETSELKLVEVNLNDFEVIDPNIRLGLDAIYDLCRTITSKSSKSKLFDLVKSLMDKNQFFIDYILVIPPSYRPFSIGNDGTIIMDDINRYYLTILNLEKPKNLRDYKTISLYECQLQKAVIELYKYVIGSIGKKEGLLRNHMAGRRIDFSGRAVITPDATLSLNEARIPRYILLQLWQLELIEELISEGKFVSFRYAYDYLQEMYLQQNIDESIVKLIDKISTGKIVLLNRQPTLHRGSLMAFKVVPGDGFAIGINPLVCDPFNADFDGDQMAVYRPLTQLAISEAESKMLPSNNLYSASNGNLQFIPKQDIVYGLYKIALQKKEILEEIFGHKISPTLTKKQLIEYLSKDAAKDWRILDKLKDIGFAYTLEFPSTLSISDFPDIEIDNITGNWIEDSRKLEEFTKVLKEKFPKADIVDSGARASWDQVRQMVTSRGYVSDFLGNVVPHYIKNSYSKGLNQEEFFYSSNGTRKALLDTALNVSDSGYLTRRLIYASSLAKLGPEIDCGSTNTLPIVVNSKIARNLKYRNYYLQDPKLHPDAELKTVTESDINNLIGKRIFLRSPITCKSKDICRTCYGGLYAYHKSPYIGFIAAQSLGERSTQLILRTFHTGGVAQGTGTSNEDIISAISQVTNITDKRKKITSLNDIVQVVLDLFNIFKDYGDIHLVHFETLVEQMLYNVYGENMLKFRFDLDEDQNYRYDYTWKLSIKTIPSIQSWFLGMIFENTRRNLINGLVNSNDSKPSILESIILGKISE
ncbi:MAG: hypothetical protein ACPLX8_00080 [Nanopusillaceae archaeon]